MTAPVFVDVDPFAGPPPTEVQAELAEHRANPVAGKPDHDGGICGDIVIPGSADHMATMSASKIASVVGLSPYTSAYTLWHQMAGLQAPDEDRPVFQRGHLLEPAVANWFAAQHPEWAVVDTGTWTHPTRPHQTASPDRIVIHDLSAVDNMVPSDVVLAEHPGIPTTLLEIKSTTKDWEWGTPGTAEVPDYYWVQAQWQMDTTGHDTCHFAIIGSYLEFSAYVVHYDPRVAALLRREADAFMASLAAAQPPAIDYHATTLTTIRERHPNVSGDTVEIDPEIAAAYVQAKMVGKQLDELETGAKSALALAMGDAKAATCHGITIATRRPARAGATPSIYPGKQLDAFAAAHRDALERAADEQMVNGWDEPATENVAASTGPPPGAPDQGEAAGPATVASPAASADAVVISPDDLAGAALDAIDMLEARNAWIIDRLTALKTTHPDRFAAFRDARHLRLPDLAPRPPWTNDEIDAIVDIVAPFETAFGATDPAEVAARAQADADTDWIAEPDPAPAPETPAWGTDGPGCALAKEENAAGILASLASLNVDHPDRYAIVKLWHDDAKNQGRPWKGGEHHDGISVRQWHLIRAALCCLRTLWDAPAKTGYGTVDDRTRHLLALTIGEDLQPAWRTGAVFGSLTIDQAESLCTTAALFADGDRSTRAVVRELVTASAAA